MTFQLLTRTFRFIFLITFILIGVDSAHARRIGLASKFSIPSLEESHLVIGSPSESSLNPSSIKVLVWNILKSERTYWSYDFTQMSADKDILLLQEGYLNEIANFTFNNLFQFRFDMGVSFLYRKDHNTPTGTIVGAKVSPVETGFLRTKNYEPLIKTPKTITYGIYPIQNHDKNLLVLSIHGMNFTPQSSFNKQIEEALELIDSHDGPVIFAGDFNTHNKKRLSFLRNKMVVRKFKEIGYINDKRKKFLGNPLDHTFAKGLLVRDSRVLANITSSDHKALSLEFVLDTNSK